MHKELVCNFDGIAKDRRIKKNNFYVLRVTSMPACLLEIGFHTNKAELTKMLTDDWKDRIVRSVVGACNAFELNN
jgi:N-acetylmuramoyl-L-alanine amidase